LKGNHDCPGFYFATLALEFWNRRKYPVILRSIEAKFSTIELQLPRRNYTAEIKWHVVAGNSMYTQENEVLEPAAHRKFEIDAPFARRPVDGLEDKITIKVSHYDPWKNKHETILQTFVWRLGT
jgi:hypothetical protein